MTRPVEIVGGGLAGLSLGRALVNAGARVTVYEAGDYPRERVCGEFICGLRDDVARALDLAPILTGALRHRRVAWHWRDRRVRDWSLPKPALGLSRRALDQRLANAFVQCGGDLRTHARVSRSDTRPGRLWASGRRTRPHGWLGLKAHCRGLNPAADLEFHFGEDAYVGLAAVEDNQINVCALFRPRPHLSAPASDMLPAYLRASGLASLSAQVEATMIRGTHAAVAGITFDQQIPRDRAIVGDAFAMIPPFTGDGMAMAFESASLALEPLLDYANGRIDWENAAALLQQRMRRRLHARIVFARLLQTLLVRRSSQVLLSLLARADLLPFCTLFRWLH